MFPAQYFTTLALLAGFQETLAYPFDPTRLTPSQAGEPSLAQKTLKTLDGETLIV